MARSARIKRKDLFAPDEFITFSRRAADFVTENRNTVITVVGGALVLLIAVVAFQAISSNREESAAVAYQAGQSMLGSRQHEKAASAFADVVQRYGSTSHGVLARLQLGHALLQAGRPGEAAAAYEGFLKAGPPADYLRQLAETRLATAKAAQGDAGAAQAAFAAAAQDGGLFAGEALLGEAQAAESKGDADTAKRLYARFLQEHPTSSLRQLVSARLVALGGAPAASESS